MNQNLSIEEYFCNEDNNTQDEPKEIFKLFISSDPNDFEEIKTYQNKQQSLCGANVPEGSTTFQCFDCAPDPHHMYCRDCFVLDYHIGHRAFYKRGMLGCCDCGDASAIADTKSFCKLHQDSKVDKEVETNKISPKIKEKILQFLKDVFTLYFQVAETAAKQLSKIKNPSLLKCYAICEVIQFQKLSQLLQKNLKLRTIYQDCIKIVRVNEILMEFLLWLCKDRACFALLIADFLKTKLENQKTYFEQYVSYSIVLDLVSLTEDKSFQSLIYLLNIDDGFRLYTQDVYLLQQGDLWRYYDIQDFDGSNIVEDFIVQFEYFKESGIMQTKERIAVQLFQNYFKRVQEANFISKQIYVAHYFSLDSQFVSEEFQQIQFTSPMIQNLFKAHTYLQTIINQYQVQDYSPVFTMNYFFQLKFQYNYFIKSFKTTLTEIFPEYETKELSFHELSKLPPKKFFLEQLLESYAQVKGFSSNDKRLLLYITQINQAFRFLQIESTQLGLIKECLKKYLATNNVSNFGKLNLLKLLLYFGFHSIKQHKNQPNQYNYLQEFYKNNLEQNQIEKLASPLKVVNTFIYRSGSMIDKYFTLVLSKFFVEKNFQNSNQFNEFLEQSMLCEKEDIYNQMKLIFERCVHNFISFFKTPQDEYLQQVYYGNQNKEQMICYDIAFIKMFVILYQQQALNQMISILQQRQYFHQTDWKQYYVEIIARIIGPDQSFYCLCASLFSNQNIPQQISFVLYQLLSNLFILNHYQEFHQVKKQFDQANFHTGNLDQYILEFCELDESVNKLQMKSLDKIFQYFKVDFLQQNHLYYEPFLFFNGASIGQEIHDYLGQQKNPLNLITFGNGIQWMTDFHQLSGCNLQLNELLGNQQNMEFFLSELQSSQEPKLLIQILNRIIHTNKLINKDLYKFNLENLSKINLKSQLNQSMIQLILTENQIEKSEVQIVNDTKKNQQQNLKVNKMKAKFQQKIAQFSQIENAQLNSLNEVNILNDVCSVCKLQLEEGQKFCIPILIQTNPSHKFYDLYPPQVKQIIFTPELNLLKLSITNCKHKFHDDCLTQINRKQVKYPYLDKWFQIQCPICKLSSETRLSINKIKGKTHLQVWLQLEQKKLGIDKQLYEKYGDKENLKLFEIYLSLLTDLTFQLFVDIKEFIRQDKYLAFNSLLDLIKELQISQNDNRINLQKSENVIITIIYLIIQVSIVPQSQENLEISLYDEINNLQLEDEYIQQILLCFGLEKQESIQQKLVQFNVLPFNKIQIKEMLSEQIKSNLCLNFKEFYTKYFYKTPCSYCKYISDKPKNDDQFVCLFCFKKICNFECELMNTKSGNLNIHSKENHQGICIYVSVQTGRIAVLSTPLTFLYYKHLYQNKFGQPVKIFSIDTNWEDYNINNKVLNDVVELILNNSVKSLIKNQELNVLDWNESV